MPTYVISDIHGCYDQYRALLHKINFSKEDRLIVLGDVIDRGPDPIKVLLDLMHRENVTLIMGNHEATAITVLRQLTSEITVENISSITPDFLNIYSAWLEDGGASTIAQFQKLHQSVQKDILNFLQEAPLFETIEHNGKLYVMVHAGLGNFDISKELEEYEPEELLWGRPDYNKEYFPSGRIFLITGHTPTPLIREDKQPLIYRNNSLICIDCGCCFNSGKLAAYCIETGETFYVEGLSGSSK